MSRRSLSERGVRHMEGRCLLRPQRWDAAPAVEGAQIAEGPLAAEVLADVDEHGVVLVVKGNVVGKVFYKEQLEFFIVFFVGHNTVAREDPFGIGVDDKDGLFSGIEQDGISGLWTSPIDREQLCAQAIGFLVKHLF